MIEAYENDPRLERYLIAFQKGQTIFLEGDESQDLYVLLEGELDVLKGDQVISILSGPEAVFGEMSFLTGDKRTASIRARSQGKALQVPRGDIGQFLQQFPGWARTWPRSWPNVWKPPTTSSSGSRSSATCCPTRWCSPTKRAR